MGPSVVRRSEGIARCGRMWPWFVLFAHPLLHQSFQVGGASLFSTLLHSAPSTLRRFDGRLICDTMEKLKPDSGLARAARYAVPFVLLLIPFWMIQINAVVPEPYLDEEFHVPQAQTYWEHKWTQWNPKITTPPGLYFWSYAICAALLAVRGSPTQLSTEACRGTNVAAATVFLPWRLQKLLDQIRKQRNDRPSGAWLSHTVLNICLFPPLFFFSGLYYTDILALLAVVEAYNWDLKRMSGLGVASVPTLVFTGLGVAALAFRQTNIFWVAIFLGGLRVIRKLRVSSKPCQSTGFVDVARRGYNNELFDPLVSEASFLGSYSCQWDPGAC